MAADPKQIQDILAALAQQRSSATPTTQNASQPPPNPTYPASQGAPNYGQSASIGIPAPASSGNLDLTSIRPVQSGTMNFDHIMSKIRATAAEKGATPYDRPLVYNSEPRHQERPQYRSQGRSRSRSPQRSFGDGGNPYQDDRRTSRGREYSTRDRSYSPGPRGGTFSPRGNGRERSPLRATSGGAGGLPFATLFGGDDQSETIQIESSLVGLIIGRQGENLRRIEAESNCRVQFLPATDGGPFRQCKISGPRPRRAEVKDAINRIIEDSGMGPLNRSHEKPRDAGTTASREGEDHMQIMVPDRTVGLIIGRGGETIRDLQERSGCHINIVGESKSINGLRPVNLIGTPQAAAIAKDAIMEIVDSDSRGEVPASGNRSGMQASGRNEGLRRDGNGAGGGVGGPDKITDSVFVPSEAVGMIIGKGGETIRDMQATTGCKINVAQSSGPGETQREISLVGSRDSIARAKQVIDEKVEAVKQKGSGRNRGHYDQQDRGNHSHQPTNHSTNSPSAQASSADPNDPYAQYGGYQNYVALWYQSLMYQQQQGGGQGAPAGPPPQSS